MVTEDLDCDVDSSATILSANIPNRDKFNSYRCLPSDDYSSLTPEERELWRKLSPNMKSIIIKGRKINNRPNKRFNSNEPNNHSCKPVKCPSYNETPFTKSNLHELLNELIVESNE